MQSIARYFICHAAITLVNNSPLFAKSSIKQTKRLQINVSCMKLIFWCLEQKKKKKKGKTRHSEASDFFDHVRRETMVLHRLDREKSW